MEKDNQEKNEELFTHIGSLDFLSFEFAQRSYSQQLSDAISLTKNFCGVTCSKEIVQV